MFASKFNRIKSWRLRPLLTLDDIIVFSVFLCDTNIDDSYRTFTDKAIRQLSENIIGRTGDLYCGQNIIGEDIFTTVEIFDTEIICNSQVTTLNAFVYVEKKDIPTPLQYKLMYDFNCCGHFFYLADSECSICGKNHKSCNHKVGEFYNNYLCYNKSIRIESFDDFSCSIHYS